MNEDTPLVSIVLPTYNRATVLDRSIDSILEQTFENFRLHIVDDNSSDHTAEVVHSYDDPRIEYIAHETNRGAPAARNTGIRKAEGEFIAFQDSDDVWDPEKLEKQIELFESSNSNVGVVYCGMWRIFNDGERKYVPVGDFQSKRGDIHETLLEYNFVSTQTAVVRSECFDVAGGFDEQLSRLQDWELWIRISESFEFDFVNEPLVSAYVQGDSISEDSEALSDARECIFTKHEDKFGARVRGAQLFRVGHSALKAGDSVKGRRYLFRAVRTDPCLKYLLLFLFSLSGSYVYNTGYNAYKAINNVYCL